MRRFVVLCIAMLVCAPTAVLAEAPKDPANDATKAAAPPVGWSPERTTASFGDWIFKCEISAPPGKRVCEIDQAINVQGQSAPIAQIAFTRASPPDVPRVILVLPTNVTLTSMPRIFGEKDDKSPLDLIWQRCVQGGCIASAVVTDEVIAKFGARTEPGIITFKDAGARDLAIPLSFRGFAQASAAAAKEP